MLNVLNRAIEKILLNWGRPLEKLLSGGGGGGGGGHSACMNLFSAVYMSMLMTVLNFGICSSSFGI